MKTITTSAFLALALAVAMGLGCAPDALLVFCDPGVGEVCYSQHVQCGTTICDDLCVESWTCGPSGECIPVALDEACTQNNGTGGSGGTGGSATTGSGAAGGSGGAPTCDAIQVYPDQGSCWTKDAECCDFKGIDLDSQCAAATEGAYPVAYLCTDIKADGLPCQILESPTLSCTWGASQILCCESVS